MNWRTIGKMLNGAPGAATAMTVAALSWPEALAAHPGHGAGWAFHLHAEQVGLAALALGVLVVMLWKLARSR